MKQVPGRKIGNITTRGNIIQLELDEGVIGRSQPVRSRQAHLRFTPSRRRRRRWRTFRAENLPLAVGRGDRLAAAGQRRPPHEVPVPVLRQDLGRDAGAATGLITFGGGYNDLGLGRFVHLQQVGPDIVNKIPLIAAFLKQRMTGTRYVNELDDRVVMTWDTSEPTSGQQDVTFMRTPHNYQAVLYRTAASISPIRR